MTSHQGFFHYFTAHCVGCTEFTFIKFVMSQKRKSPLPKLTSEQQERLIDLVEENQLLYDVTMKDHRDRRVITNTWKKIARELDVEEWGSPSASDPRAKNTGQRATKGTVLTSQSLSPWCDCRRLGSTWASWRWQDINVGNPL